MNIFVLMILLAMLVLIVFLILRQLSMHATAREIAKGFEMAVRQGSNTLITVSTGDTAMRDLADKMNDVLQVLRSKRHMYEAGDRRIKDGISNVAHDLRTPLTAIIGYLELLQDEDNPEKARKYVRIIRERAEAMRALTGELFDWAVASHPEKKEELVPVRLQDALAESIAVNYPAFREKGVRPVMDFPEESVVREADRKSLARVFGNLITNGLQHGEGNITISLHSDGRIDFSNRAPDLDALDIERIFDKFYSVRNGSGSTGLGLSIARMLSEKMHGSMEASLDDGVLTVSISFPPDERLQERT